MGLLVIKGLEMFPSWGSGNMFQMRRRDMD